MPKLITPAERLAMIGLVALGRIHNQKAEEAVAALDEMLHGHLGFASDTIHDAENRGTPDQAVDWAIKGAGLIVGAPAST